MFEHRNVRRPDPARGYAVAEKDRPMTTLALVDDDENIVASLKIDRCRMLPISNVHRQTQSSPSASVLRRGRRHPRPWRRWTGFQTLWSGRREGRSVSSRIDARHPADPQGRRRRNQLVVTSNRESCHCASSQSGFSSNAVLKSK